MKYRKINKIFLVASAIIKNSEDKILLLKRSNANKTFNTYWQLPEGKLEVGEKIQNTIDREVLEETNLKIVDKEFSHTSINTIKLGKDIFLVVRVVFLINKYSQEINLSFEHKGFGWFTREEILIKPRLVPGVKEAVDGI